MKPPLFELGRIHMTPGAIEAFLKAGKWSQHGKHPAHFIDRHARGDWGDLDEDDRAVNEHALKHGHERLFSAYKLHDGATIWIITEADRSLTTVLVPEEY